MTLASDAGRRGFPHETVYCATKFGQVGFTRALDHELRPHGIRCTNVCPGGVATRFGMDDGRGLQRDEAAERDDDSRRTWQRSCCSPWSGRGICACSRPRFRGLNEQSWG